MRTNVKKLENKKILKLIGQSLSIYKYQDEDIFRTILINMKPCLVVCCTNS